MARFGLNDDIKGDQSINMLNLPRRQRQTESDDDIERQFAEIQARSGHIQIGPQIYTNVKIENLNIKAMLGSGTCGNVTKRVFHNWVLAVKEMRKTDNEKENKRVLMDLKVILKCNDCPYIVQSYGYILTYDQVYICMETMAMCFDNLYRFHLISKGLNFPEEILGKLAVSVINALKYLKDIHKTMHRDIKPSNILIDWNGHIKLCDFGIAGQLIDSFAATSSTGCIAYLSPERTNHLNGYDVRADVWSLGITLHELAMCEHPYGGVENQMELMLKINEKPPPELPMKFSVEFRQFVFHCLIMEEAARPKYENLIKFQWYKLHQNIDITVGEWLSSVVMVDEEEED